MAFYIVFGIASLTLKSTTFFSPFCKLHGACCAVRFDRTYPSWPPLSSIKRSKKPNKPTSSTGHTPKDVLGAVQGGGVDGSSYKLGQCSSGSWAASTCHGNVWDRSVSESALHSREWSCNDEGRGRVLEMKVTLWTLIADSSALALMLPESSVAPVTLGRGIHLMGGS